MPAFEVYIDDDRYRIPSLYLVEARDAAAAQRLAGELLRNSSHHLGVEVRRDGVRLFGEGTLAQDTEGCELGVAAAG